jgi:hypothetical protein
LPCGYARVGDAIYYHSKHVPGADAATFEVLTPENCVTVFARDKNHAYRFATPLEGIDAKSFRVVGYLLFADRNHVYQDGLPKYRRACDQADPMTYSSFPVRKCEYWRGFSDYGRDARRVFYRCAELPGADPATFEVIAADDCPDLGTYARDGKSVWHDGKVIPGADRDSFRVERGGWGSDKNRRYFAGRPLP